MNYFTERCAEMLRAISKDDLERVKQLLDSGIPVNTVLHSPVRREHATVLGTSAYEGRTEIVKYLLSIRTNVNYKDPRLSRNALHWAALGGSSDVVKLLIENDADVNAKDRDNVTALIRSAIRGYTAILKLLIQNGADVNHHDRLHSSALHYASFFAHSHATGILIKAGCVQNNSSVFGQGTPLANLFYHGDVKNSMLLVEAGYNLQNECSWIELTDPDPASSLHSDLASCLMYNLKNPRSLKSTCRLKIRDHFRGRYVQAKIKHLPLPQEIVRYLLLEDL